MSVSIDMQVENPDSVEVSLSMRMNLGDWKRLRKQLVSDYPSWKLGQAIAETVEHVDKHFRSTEIQDATGDEQHRPTHPREREER